MKDATGELSMTAVAVVAIAAIGVVFSTMVWPQIRTNILRSSYCANAFDCDEGDGSVRTCHYCKNNDDNVETCDQGTITCSSNDSKGR